MLQSLISSETESKLNEIIRHTGKAVVTAHVSPDGDAVGSCLGLTGWLRSIGIKATVVLPDRIPDFLAWLPGANYIVCHDPYKKAAEKLMADADTLFCLDFNDARRTKGLAPLIEASKAKKVVIDHHLAPTIKSDIMISHPEMSSTCELVFRLLWQMGYFDEMTRNEAICIYCGMMTDTGGFTYNSTNPEIYYIISQLLTKGFDKDKVYRKVYNNYSKNRVKLTGYILYNKLHFYDNLHACYYTLTADEMHRFDFHKGDAEGLVNMPLVVKGMKLSAALREDTENGHIRISLRSVDDFPCNRMAADFFNGGGHLNASGGELDCTMDEAVKVMDEAVKAYSHMLK